jgi:ketopantoate hydroxymethyltransferase
MLKNYRDFQQEFERLQQERENAFQEFYDDVHAGVFQRKKILLKLMKMN